MSANLIEDMNGAGQASFEAIQKLGAINTKALTDLANLQVSLTTLSVEGSVEQMKLVSGTKDVNDFIAAETEFATGMQNKIMEISQQANDILSGSQDEVAKWMKAEMPLFADFEQAFTKQATAVKAKTVKSAKTAKKSTAAKAKTTKAKK